MLNFLIELYRNARVEKCKPSFLSFGRQICTMVPGVLSGDARIWGWESRASLNRFASVPDITLFFFVLKYLDGGTKAEIFAWLHGVINII